MEDKTLNREDVFRIIDEKGIKFIRLCFTDVLGFLKSFSITREQMDDAFENGIGFDGSSIEGFARIEESDMVAMPDPSTFRVLPWRPDDENDVAFMFCDILDPHRIPYNGDSRWALKRNLKKASDLGYTFYVGPELEYFYFERSSGNPVPLDVGGYFDLTPNDIASDFRRYTINLLGKMGIKVEYSHHEVAPSQHEIDLHYSTALPMADTVMTYRLVVKEVAMKNNKYATFMPKPIYGQNGSGMHTHQSLFKGTRNAFYDPNDKYYLSNIAKSYIAGLLFHAREICAIVAQWVNSYKRLVPGYEAPVYISWGQRNRSALVRVPFYRPGKEDATRAEFRCPDPACNPYLAFSVMLAAGLKGIEEGYKLPGPIEEDIFAMAPSTRTQKGILSLPGSLAEAIEETEKSQLVKEALGEHIFYKFINNKKIEWDRYHTHVSQYEIDKYLPIL